MKGLLIYKGKYGATRQYADWLKDLLNVPITTPDEIKANEIKQADYLVIGSSVYVGKLLIRHWLKENVSQLVNKKIFMFVVSATPATEKVKLDGFMMSVPAELRYLIEIYYLPGKMTKKNLSFLDNIILHMGAWLSKDLVEKKNMLTDFDALDINKLNDLVNSIKTFEKSQETPQSITGH